jgi:penicillin amidase
MLRSLRGLLALILVLLLAAALLWAWARTSLPRRQGSVALSGLSATVEVGRDSNGVPRIVAQSLEDAFFALGFVHAQDRLWQLEEDRLRGAGRLAEVLGERALAGDLLFRTLAFRRAAERDLEALTPRARGVVQAYSDGINAFLERQPGALPPEFALLGHRPEPWSAADVLARAKLFAWERSSDWRDELLRARLVVAAGAEAAFRLWPAAEEGDAGPAAEELLAGLPLAPLHELADTALGNDVAGDVGSVAWVVDGSRSASGAPLMAQAIQGGREAPAAWYQVSLAAPGLELSGATVPGLPLVLSGRNEQIAWSIAGSGTDSQDLFIERIAGDRYLGPDGWQELETSTETVLVRGGDEVRLKVRRSRHGPLVSDLLPVDPLEADGEDERLGLALAWSALQETDLTLQGALDLAFAGSWSEFGDALRNLDEPALTVLYADAEGNTGVQATGRVPMRRHGGGVPVPGWDGTFDWAGFAPYSEMPRLSNPAGGRIVAISEDYPGAPPFSAAPSRAGAARGRGLHELLDGLDHHTPSSFRRMLAQRRMPLAAELLPLARSARPVEAAEQKQAELLGWEGELAGASEAVGLLAAWYPVLARLAFEDDLGAELAAELAARPRLVLSALAAEPEWCDDRHTEVREECRELATKALAEAVSRSDREPGYTRNGSAFAEVHVHEVMSPTTLAELFDVRVKRGEGFPGRGVEESGSPLLDPGRGEVYRAVYDLAAGAPSWFALPTGQSGNPLSSGYRALAGRWARGELLPLAGPAVDAAEAGEEPEEGFAVLLLEPRR